MYKNAEKAEEETFHKWYIMGSNYVYKEVVHLLIAKMMLILQNTVPITV
jgi:hypothetical protein